MKNLLEKHEFWACLALLGMVMAIITGHQMVGGDTEEKEEKD